MLFNTVYTWGKLLGATYLLIAVGLVLETCKSDEARSNLGLVPAALTLSYLSHAGNAVAGLAFLIVFWSVLRWREARVLAIGAIAALAIIAPWGYWTQSIQPGGNALLRFQLANDYGFDRRSVPVLSSMIEYLHSIGWQGWLMMKLRWFAWLFNVNGYFPLSFPVDTQTASFWANQRSLDFVVVSRTIGVASIGVFAALWRRAVHGDFRDRLALRLVGCGALGIVIVILLIVQVGITHHHAYGAIIMIGIGGAMFLADRRVEASKLSVCRLAGLLCVRVDLATGGQCGSNPSKVTDPSRNVGRCSVHGRCMGGTERDDARPPDMCCAIAYVRFTPEANIYLKPQRPDPVQR